MKFIKGSSEKKSEEISTWSLGSGCKDKIFANVFSFCFYLAGQGWGRKFIKFGILNLKFYLNLKKLI